MMPLSICLGSARLRPLTFGGSASKMIGPMSSQSSSDASHMVPKPSWLFTKFLQMSLEKPYESPHKPLKVFVRYGFEIVSKWVDGAMSRTPHRRVILDMDSSESPVHGDQEGASYNGHFGSTCYHPLFVFNQFGDCEGAKLRAGNVHSAHRWRDIIIWQGGGECYNPATIHWSTTFRSISPPTSTGGASTRHCAPPPFSFWLCTRLMTATSGRVARHVSTRRPARSGG